MDVERTIEFLLKNQARMDTRMDAKFAKADARLDRLERLMGQNNRIVAGLARYGVSLRSDVRRIDRTLVKITARLDVITNRLDAMTVSHAETDEKLSALIDFVDRQSRGNGRREKEK